ncbi:MAG: DNA-directed RNA polymerase subunit RpoH/Rpb5 C-terminal domain-containing protein [Candidatus Nanoarchaeia archaeon]
MNTPTNFLIPPHRKLEPSEVDDLLKQYGISKENLPKMNIKDPALAMFDIAVESGDVIEITRTSFVGKRPYYRLVVS